MAKLLTHRGHTSKLVRIFVQDTSKTTGAGLTGLVFNSAGLSAYYFYEGDSAARAITLVTATLGAWVSGGFVEVDAIHMPGVYEVGIPDAALATGNSVVLYLQGATNMAPVIAEFDLVAFDPQDSVRLALTALPNANAGANGGLPTGNASGQVTVGAYAGGEDPGTLVLSNPAHKVLVDASGNVAANNLPSDYQQRGVAVTLPTNVLSSADETIIEAALTAQGYTTARAGKLDNLDAAISTLASALVIVLNDLSAIETAQGLQATSAALATAQTAITAIKTITDQIRFTVANQVDANALSGGGGGGGLDLSTPIPVSPAPTVGTVGEALAAARAAAIGKEEKSGNAVALLASDDSTTLATNTYNPSIAAPTSRTRS